MASEINYNCGCGYHTQKLEEAIIHSNSKHHTITVLGTIKPETKKED